MSFCPQCGKELKDKEICDCQINKNYGNRIETDIEKKFDNKKKIIIRLSILIVAVVIIILLFMFLGIKNSKEVLKGSEETENFKEEEAEYFEAEKSDFEHLENMLEGLNYIADLEFDSSTTNFEDIFLYLISDSYYFFENTVEEICDDYDLGKKADPKKNLYRYDISEEKDKYSYFKLKGNDIDWISKNIYNIEPNHSIDIDTLYYDNGYFYILASDGYVYYNDGYTIPCKNEKYTVDIMNYKYYENGRYYITIEYSYNSDERSINYIEATLKNIDGKRQWTIYKNSACQFNFGEEYGGVVEYKELNPIDYDYYKNKENEKNKKMRKTMIHPVNHLQDYIQTKRFLRQ